MRWIVVMLSALLIAGCSSAPEAAPAADQSTGPSAAETSEPSIEGARPIVITSADLGDPPVLATGFTQDAPQRIVSLANGVGETLVALGAGERIVGRDETSDIPALGQVPVVTQAHSVSAERVLALEPDLVIVDEGVGPVEALDQIRAAGVNVVEVPVAWTLTDIAPRMTRIAEVVGATGLTLPTFTAQSPATNRAPRVAFLYLRGPSAIYLLGGEGSGADALIQAAGGVDIGAEAGQQAFVPLTAEALATADPEILLVMTKGLESVGGIDGLLELPGVAQTTAARNQAVVAVDDGVLLSFGPRSNLLVERLRGAIGALT